jgi:methionine-rich copper-binding protein CopC
MKKKALLILFIFLNIILLNRTVIAGVTYSGSSEAFDTTSDNATPAGIHFNTDGTKVFVVGTNDVEDEVNEYSLTTAFDISTTQSITRRLAIGTNELGAPMSDLHPYGLTFNGDGTKLYISGNQNNKIFELDLGSAFNISSATKVGELATNSNATHGDGTPCGLTFNNDGTKLFLAGFANHRIVYWSLSSAYDIETAGTPGSFSVTSTAHKPRDVDFNSDGTKMYVVSGTGDHIAAFDLASAFDLSGTVTHRGNYSVNSQDNQPFTVEFSSNGLKMFMQGYNNDDIHEYSLTTAFEIINTVPTLSSSVPADNATSVAVDSTIVLNFSESVDAESGNITIKKTSDNSTVETIDVTSGQVIGSGTSQIVVTPSSDFDGSTEYYVLIDATAFDDVDSGSYAGISSTTALSFTTANTVPTLSSSVPADNATSVAADSTIVLNFNESVDAESGNITIKKTSDNSTVETIDVTGGQVTGSGTSQITVTPSSDFDASTEYYVLIDATAFDDSESGSYAGISSTTALSFTTANAVPTLSSSVPADNATSVAVDSTIVLNFSESVDAESGNITIKKTSGNSTVETIDVTGGQVTGSGTSQITVTPSSDFDSETEYYVLIDATAFDDSESGSYAGISSTTALSFTTTDTTASDPFEDKTVVALVEAQTDVPKRIIQNVSTPIFNRLQWLRNYNEDRELFSQGIKFRFSNPILASISKVVPVALTDDEEIEEEEIDTTWSFWSEGSVSIGKVGDTTSSHSKDINTTGITIGLDNKVSDRYLYGYTIRYTKDDVDVGTPGTSLDTNAYSLSTYASFLTGESKFIEGIFGFSKLDLKNVRKSGSNTLYGDRDGTQLYGSINYSTVLNRNNLNISPNIRLDISQTYLKEYSETGTDALSYDDQTIKNGALYSGVNLNNVFKFNNINLIPNAGIELGLDFSPSSDASITYVSDPNTSYMRSIDQQKSKSGKVKLGLDIITQTGFSLSTLYERNQSENSHSDTFYLGTAYITLKEAQYALSIKDNVASADYGKKLNGFDILIETDYDLFSEYPEYAINLKISSIF